MSDNSLNSSDLKIELFSGDTERVIQSLEKIKDSSCFDLIEPLFDLYVTSQNNEIKNKVFNLLCDVKDKRFVEFLLLALSKAKYKGIKKDIVSICWQSGLDFSGNVRLFIDILVAETDELSIEVYSVFESSLDFIKKEEKKSIRDYIDEKLSLVNGLKKELLQEIHYMLE